MEIGDLVRRDGIVLRGSVSSKRQALHAVAEAAAHVPGHDASSALVDALAERAARGRTGPGAGVGVPPARLHDSDPAGAGRGRWRLRALIRAGPAGIDAHVVPPEACGPPRAAA